MTARNTKQAAAPDTASMMAIIQQLQAQLAGNAPKAKAAAKSAPPAVTDHAAKVSEAAKSAGAKVVRLGKSGVTPKGYSKAWVDLKIGNIRIQGNAFVIPEKAE